MPVDASACRRQDDRCFSLAAGEVGAVDAVDDGLFPVGHHDRVAEDIDRAEAEELPLDRIDDADLRIEHAPVAHAHGRDQPDHVAVLGREPVVRRGRAVAEVVGLGDPAGERQDVAFPEGVRSHFGRNEQVPAPTRAFQPALAAQGADHMVRSLGTDAEHVDDLPAIDLLVALLDQTEDDTAFLRRQRSGSEFHVFSGYETSDNSVFC